MSFIRKHTRLLLVGACCAAAGAGAGAIATAGASTGTSGSGHGSAAHVAGGRAPLRAVYAGGIGRVVAVLGS